MTDELNQAPAGDTGAGAGDATWLDSLPEDLKGNDTLKGFDGIESLAKAHLTVQGKVADLEKQIADGKPVLPDKPEGYELPVKFEGMPDELTGMYSKQVAAVALAAGLTKEQAGKAFETLMAQELEEYKAEVAKIEKVKADTETALLREYGDKYKETMNAAFLRTAQIAGEMGMNQDEFKAFLDSTGIGDNPTFIKFAVSLSKLISPDNFKRNEAGGGDKSVADLLYPNQGKN